MARRRFRRKDLKRPDEFVNRGRQFLAWGRANVRLWSWGVGGVAVLALILGGFFSVRSARDRQANDDLTRGLGEFQAGRYSEAATQLRDVASRWSSTAAGHIADLYAANADLKADNLESASVLLNDVVNGRAWPSYLQQQAVLDLGFTLERKGDVSAAAARYAEASSLEGPYTPTAILGEARCREQAGERDKARELYERFTREFPQAPELEVVGAKLSALKGPSPG